MRYTYTYRSSDGARHSDEIEAPNRDAAFARLREERGIKPIKVVEVVEREGSRAESKRRKRGKLINYVLSVALVFLMGSGVLWWRQASHSEAHPTMGDVQSASAPPARARRTIESKVVEISVGDRVAKPHPRKYIKSLADRLDGIGCFAHPSEKHLARFAMPGMDVDGIPADTPELVDDLRDALESEIVIQADDPTDIAELKRIVAGLKDEAELHLRSGAGLKDFLKFLRLRQKMESDCRKRIIEETELDGDGRSARIQDANETLATMGLAPIE